MEIEQTSKITYPISHLSHLSGQEIIPAIGMKVFVVENQKTYIYTGKGPLSGWEILRVSEDTRNYIWDEDKKVYVQAKVSQWTLYHAEEHCDHVIELRASGVGCQKCSGWFCY